MLDAFETNADLIKNKSYRWWMICLDFDLSARFESDLRKLNLRWSKPKLFNSTNKRHVPNQQGIYIFFVKPRFQIFSEQSYIMYVGYSMNLKNRYGDYLTYKNSDEPNLLYKRMMLNIWDSTLYYSFVPINKKEKKVKEIETRIIGSIVPPVNINFLDAYVKHQVNLYRKR